MNKRFVAKYIPVYILCALGLFAACYFLIAVTKHATFVGSDYFFTTLFDPSDGSNPFGRQQFWHRVGIIPLTVYCLFCRTISYPRSMICAAICFVLSFIPVVLAAAGVYSVWGRVNINLLSYHFVVLTIIAYLYIVIDLSINKKTRLKSTQTPRRNNHE